MGQIKGTVMDNSLTPVELATIINITRHTESTSNLEGEFVIEGTIGDSIQIKHINYMISEFKVEGNNNNYLLELKNYLINEVVVSSNEASRLCKKSFENTYNRLKDKSVSRGYLRYLKTADNDTLTIQDIDLDIERQKQRSFNEGEKISIYKIQERTVSESMLKVKELSIQKYICPPTNQFDWDIFSKSYIYYKVEDSQYIKLYFLSKKSFLENIAHFEITIQKKDSCLLSFAYTIQGLFSKKNGDKLDSTKTYSYTKYDISDGYSFLSETFDSVILPNPKKGGKNIEMSLHYKTYDNGLQDLRLRQKVYKIYNNIFNPHLVTNRYTNKFWINNIGLGKADYDFEFLSNFGIDKNSLPENPD